jgi:hypothetical protein
MDAFLHLPETIPRLRSASWQIVGDANRLVRVERKKKDIDNTRPGGTLHVACGIDTQWRTIVTGQLNRLNIALT